MRLFFALQPSAQCQQQIARWRQQYLTTIGRSVIADNFHITLAFIGQANAEQLTSLIDLGRTIKAPAIHCQLDYLSCWSKPKVLFIGCSQVPSELQNLAQQLQQGCRQRGFRIDERRYVPHLTLCRKTKVIPVLTEQAKQSLNFPLSFNEFCLYESVSSSGSVRYDVRFRWPLQSAKP